MTSDLQDANAVANEPWEETGPTVSLVEALTWLGEAKMRVLGAATVCAGIGLGLALLLPATYTATTTFLPPAATQQQGGSAAALAALGSLGGLAGAGVKTPDEMYVALLSADSVLRGLDARFKLRERYGVDTHEALRRGLGEYVRVSADKKSGLIRVDVEDRDPAFAANLANAHAEEISKVLGRLAISESQQRRVFYERQIKESKESLVQAEAALREVQEKSGVVALERQAESAVTGIAQLRAAIAEREVSLKGLRVGSTEQNPAVLRLNAELAALRAELARAESTKGASAVGMPLGKLPATALDYVRARREVKIQEALMEGLIRQYEIAKLDEAKESPTLQQVDVAQVPERKSAPRTGLLAVGGLMLGLLAAMTWVLGRSYVAKLRNHDPESAASWAAMGRAWRWSRR